MMFRTLLPPNATPGELAQERVISHVGDVPIDIRIVKNPDLCPAELLPWLAWEYAVMYWEETWSEQQKREVIKNATVVNKQRGTPGAVRRALTAVDRTIELIEWFQDTPPGAPYTFRVIVYGVSITQEELEKVVAQITDAKNARSFLSDLRIGPQALAGTISVGGALFVRQSTTLTAKRRDE